MIEVGSRVELPETTLEGEVKAIRRDWCEVYDGEGVWLGDFKREELKEMNDGA